MSSTEPPTGSVPPDPNLPPASATPPPPPPPPPAAYGAGPAAYPVGATGVGQPGTLVDRMVARIIDHLIVGIPSGIVVGILAVASNSYVVSGLIAALIYTAAFLGYFGYFESTRGQGFGKQIMKLKVVGPDGHSNPTMEQAIRRNAWTGATILYIIPVVGALFTALIELGAIILCAVNINSNVPDRRTWFDTFASGTQVVKIG